MSPVATSVVQTSTTDNHNGEQTANLEEMAQHRRLARGLVLAALAACAVSFTVPAAPCRNPFAAARRDPAAIVGANGRARGARGSPATVSMVAKSLLPEGSDRRQEKQAAIKEALQKRQPWQKRENVVPGCRVLIVQADDVVLQEAAAGAEAEGEDGPGMRYEGTSRSLAGAEGLRRGSS